MTEIRTIKNSEAEAFLELLCSVFDLDYHRAHSIFFSEPFYDLNRKWALFESNRMVSILTSVPLEFGWGRAAGIAGVATLQQEQGAGHATKLLRHVIRESECAGETGVMLFARDTRLYERIGFQTLDEVVRGRVVAKPESEIPDGIGYEVVREIYDAWSHGTPNRLHRDDLRWQYWRWNLRVSTAFHEGYLCFEGGVVREIVLNKPTSDWMLPPDTEWFGLASMADRLGARLVAPETDLYLMGLNVPGLPEFFMTDQF